MEQLQTIRYMETCLGFVLWNKSKPAATACHLCRNCKLKFEWFWGTCLFLSTVQHNETLLWKSWLGVLYSSLKWCHHCAANWVMLGIKHFRRPTVAWISMQVAKAETRRLLPTHADRHKALSGLIVISIGGCLVKEDLYTHTLCH